VIAPNVFYELSNGCTYILPFYSYPYYFCLFRFQ